MRAFWNRMSAIMGTIFRVLVIFAIVRLAFGVIAIVFLSDDSVAYSLRATGIFAAATIVAIGVALVVRGYRRPQRPTPND